MSLTATEGRAPARGSRKPRRSAAARAGWVVVFALAVVAAGCDDPRLPGAQQPAQPTGAPTSMEPSATPTPTATSLPLAVSDTLRTDVERDPVPEPGATCGVVDTLDFPVGPPDGERFLARWTFGRFSSRRDKYHAGEDWLRTHGQSLGAPVHAVGHGTVTYAEPWGWGGDKGVVIVRHVFDDHRTTLSFYGHLDPPSVVLSAGDCVTRGEVVGAIGQPNTRPHLHFEIRDHMPDTPGPGYWDTYPTGAGWHPPSELIWAERIRSAPAVAWTRSITTTDFTMAGVLADGALVAVEGDAVLGLDPESGAERWRVTAPGLVGGDGPDTPAATAAVSAVDLDSDRRTLYVATRDGRLIAFDSGQDPPVETWRRDLPGAGPVSLAPLPDGGVAAHAQWQLTAYDRDGRLRWRLTEMAAPTASSRFGDYVLLSTDQLEPAVHAVDPSGRLLTLFAGSGRPVASATDAWVHATDGVYAVDPVGGPLATANVLRLEPWIVPAGDAVALDDGGLLVSHREHRDRRLVALNADGSLRWAKSVRELDSSAQPVRVVAMGTTAAAVTGDGDVYAIDPETGQARKAFEGGAGPRMRGDVQALAMSPGRLVLDFRGGQLVALDLGRPLAGEAP